MDRYQGNTDIKPVGTLESFATCAGIAALAGAGAFVLLLLLGDWSFLQAIFGGFVVFAILTLVLSLTVGRPKPLPRGNHGTQAPTADLARADMAGTPGEAGRPLAPRDLSKPSPHKEGIDFSPISDTRTQPYNDPAVNKAIAAEAAPATRVPSPAPINAEDAAVARPVGATTNPVPMAQPAPLSGAIVSPEPPQPIDPDRAAAPKVSRNAAAQTAAPRPAPTATTEAQSYNEVDPAPATKPATKAKPAPKAKAAAPAPKADAASAAAAVPAGQEEKPTTLAAPRDGVGDDLKRIKGVGPKLEQTCKDLGFYHFDQIASWTDKEVAWVDQNLTGFRGRVSRDDWVSQAKLLAQGGETAFSKKVDKGDVY